MSLFLVAVGTAQPPDHVSQDDGLRLARKMSAPDVRGAGWLSPLYARSGIRRRHQVLGGQTVRDVLAATSESGSPFLPTAENDGLGPTTGERMRAYAAEAGPLALRAAERAVAESGFEPRSFTHLVTVSCTGFDAPGVDLALIRGLGLAPTVERTHVGFMGCHGALNGLRVANAFASADPAARALLCAVELCSLHYYYGSDADKLVANSIFADGAAAVVGCGRSVALPERARHWRVAATGSCVIPDSTDSMGWTVGDRGFEMMLSRRIPAAIARHLRPWLEVWLGKNGVAMGAVGSWAVHPGGPKILSAVEEGLNLPPDALATSREVYADCGNMSSPTVLFVLERLRRAGAALPCVALGFGPGLVAEATLLTE